MRAICTASLPCPLRTVCLADDATVQTCLDGFPFEEILTWLTSGPSTVTTWDLTPQVNYWTATLDVVTRISLMASLRTKVGEWRLLYVPGKFLELRKLRKLWRVFDVSGFWPQGSSLSEIATKWTLSTSEQSTQFDTCIRSEWRGWLLPAIGETCTVVATLISRLMTRVLAALERASLKPTWLHGVGAIGSRLLREGGGNRWIARYRPDRQPEVDGVQLLPLMLAAYHGGRVEATVQGSWSIPTYDYDLRSAYPWALAWMPPVGYRWEQSERWTDDPELRMSLWYVRWDVGTCSLGPFPYRRQNGTAVYPTQGQGWYWWPEVRSALSAYGESAIRVIRGYVSPENSNPMLAPMVRERYRQRAELEAAGDPTADILKGGLQSVYGRLCQTVGEDGAPGRFYNPALAGWVTSAVRARIIDAYRGREGTVCAISTDGILSTQRLGIAPSARLGGWRVEQYDHASLVLPGLYSLLRDAGGDLPVRHEGASGLPPGVLFDRLLQDLTWNGLGQYPTSWFVPNILPDLFPDRWEAQRCRWVKTTSTVDPYSISSKRAGADRTLDMDWRTDFTYTYAWGKLSEKDGESYPGPPAWSPQGFDPIRDAMLRASKT